MQLLDKKVIVTGGANGIGKNLVERFISEGAIVGVLDFDRNGLKALKKNYKDVFTLQCDVSNFSDVTTCVNKFYKTYKNIDILVNNAGIIYSSPLISIAAGTIKKHDVDVWHKVINTDLSSVFYMTVNVVEKMMLNRTRGVIINVSSISAKGNAGQSAYSAAKAGVNALTAVWAKELGPMRIRVAAIAPGFTDTKATHSGLSENILAEWKSKIPLRRLAKVEEIAEGVIAIIKNDFFNGKVFELDGGLVLS